MAVRLPLRRSAPGAAFLVLAAAIALICVLDRTPPTPLQTGQAYVIEAGGDRALFDLHFQADSRYLLIVSSLGAADSEYTVVLSGRAAGRVSHLPAQPLAPSPPLQETSPASRVVRVRQASATRRTRQPAVRERDFFLHVAEGSLDNPRHYARVRGVIVGTGRHVRVLLDTRLRPQDLAPGLVEDIIGRFDDEIISLAERSLGSYRDIDGDGRFTVLLTAWLGRLEGGRTSLGGFVRGADFQTDIEPPFSNRCDMMYLNADLQPGPHLGALLAHEFAHAVCFSERSPGNAAGAYFPTEEDWLNEAIAHLAENLYDVSWSNLDYRISRFLNDPARSPLVVPDYYDAGLWRDHGCRGATFLMLRWCVDQFGEDLLRRLVRGRLTGVQNLESATGMPFEELYRRWTVALATADKGAAGGYRSLDLYGSLSGWGLAGPRVQTWDVAGDGRLLVLKGTTTAFVQVHSSDPGARSLRITAAPGTRLQVTLIPLPRGAPRLNLDAEWRLAAQPRQASGDRRSPPSTVHIQAFASRRDLELERVTCEQHNGDSRASVSWTADDLPQASAFVEELQPPSRRGFAVSALKLPLPWGIRPGSPVTVKISARDAQGRRTVAWTTIAAPTIADDSPIRLASHGDRGSRRVAPRRHNPQNR